MFRFADAPAFTDDQVRALLRERGARQALLPGGVLVREDSQKPCRLHRVTERAHEFLWDPLVLTPLTTLGDLFLLLQADPVLRLVFRQDFAQEFLTHVQPALPAPGGSDKLEHLRWTAPSYSPQGVEFLELYAVWQFDSHTRAFGGMDQLQLHGLGFELKEDLNEGGGFTYPAGSRIQWSVSMTDPREMLALPVRVAAEFTVTEDDFASSRWGCALYKTPSPAVSLAQVLHGVLYDLSFHGSPAQAQEVLAGLQEQMEEVKSGEAKTVEVDLDDLFEERSDSDLQVIFQRWVPVRTGRLRASLRRIDDGVLAREGLAEKFGSAVQLNPQWAEATAKEVRRAMLDHRKGRA